MTEGVLLDVNVLVALTWDSHVHHVAAHRRFAQVDRWCTTPVTEAALLRLSLTEAVVGRRVTPSEALGQLRGIRSAAGWSFLADDSSLADAIVDTRTLFGRQQVTDMHLVNLAAVHDMKLATFDARIVEALAPSDRVHVDVWSA